MGVERRLRLDRPRTVAPTTTGDPEQRCGRFENVSDIAELVSGLGGYTGSAAPGEHGN
ncbi:hypothetical protein [Saccharopolyspora shandongensis]|uniref:hypothetical protein n=1 Tax=Saccharopolyspora shandongensis TaxID=418495 RepID=UPI001FE98212|nr:hypothetical protein [Saccharopolyspora shandongensis]